MVSNQEKYMKGKIMYPRTVRAKIDGRKATRNYKASDIIVNYYYSIRGA